MINVNSKRIFIIFLISSVIALEAYSTEIKGKVFRQGSQELVSGVIVSVLGIDQKVITDDQGEFKLTELPIGTYQLTLKRFRFRSKTIEVPVLDDQPTNLDIRLERIDFIFDEIVVRGQLLTESVSRQSVTGLEIKRIPGAGGDALRAIQALPGIKAGADFGGQLYVRGGGPEDNQIYFDRYPLANAYHFGGLVSTVSSEILQRIDIYAGGFGAEYGQDSQAIIDIYSRAGNRKNVSSKVNLNILYAEGLIEGPLGESGSWYFAGRRSYFDLFPLERVITVITAFPRFWDYQTRFNYEINEKYQIDFTAFAADDFAELAFSEEQQDEEELRGALYIKNSAHVQGFHLRALLTPRLTYDFNLSHNKQLVNFKIGQGFFLRIQPDVYDVRHDVVYEISPNVRLETGLLNSIGDVVVQLFFPNPPEEGDPNYDFLEAEKNRVDTRQDDYQVEGYVQTRFTLGEYLSFALGTRVDYSADLTAQPTPQPRFSFNLTTPGLPQLRLAYGRYLQTPQPPQFFEPGGNPELEESLSDHFILEIERAFENGTVIKAAGYRKQLDKQIEPDPEENPVKNKNYLNIGEGYAQGVEFLLQYRQGDRFFGWLSYARSVSKRRDAPDQDYRFYSYDQTHIATIIASYKFTKTFEIGGRWQYATGNPYTPLTCEENISNPCYESILSPRDGKTRKVPLYGSINSFRVEPFHRLDVRISKDFVFDTWQIGTYLELINAYNRKNVLQFSYDEEYERNEDGEVKKDIVGQLPLLPYFGVILEF